MGLDGNLLIFLLFACLAEIVGTMAGFGAATILTPIAVFFIDIKLAIPIVACFHILGNSSRLFFFGRNIHWPSFIKFGIGAVICTVIGANLVTFLPSKVIQACLALFLLVYSGSGLLGKSITVRPSTSTLVGGGILSGAIAGLIGTGGAIRSVCLLAFGFVKETYIGTSALIAFCVDATRIPIYLGRGLLSHNEIPLLFGLMISAFIGTSIGRLCVKRVSADIFRKFVLVMLLTMGLIIGWKVIV